MNYVWLLMLASGALVASASGGPSAAAGIAIASCKEAVQLSLGLAGSIALWSGIGRIAQKSGLMDALARAVRPVISPLFPSVRRDSPALGSISASIAANLLGLGSAATPFGLAAMEQLGLDAEESRRGRRQRLGAHTATDAMCTFVAVTASGFSLAPTTVISLRAEMGSSNPSAIIGAVLFAGVCSTTAAIIADAALRRRP
ncbi:MAG: nucleoside recognition domain-containing protein [Clostridia bacterium]|nr:nucleoside recognition domain-containing protein [Clostridia bacterium]